MEMVGVCPKAVKPAGNRVIVHAQHAGDVGTRHPEREQQKSGVDEEQRFVQAEAWRVAPAGENVLTGLAAEAPDVVVLTRPTVSDERVNRCIGTAKVKAIGMETGVTVGRAVFGTSTCGFPVHVGWRWAARRRVEQHTGGSRAASSAWAACVQISDGGCGSGGR